MIEIKELSPQLLSDFLAFFDHDAFADNPGWASCYCFFNHAPHEWEEWQGRSGEQNRAATSDLIRRGQMNGYLAYVDGRPVGWCNANWRGAYTTLDAAPVGDAKEAAVVCFVVAKDYRGQGIAGQLLAAACRDLERRGATAIEAYARRDATAEAANYHGPLRMYLAAGFEFVDERDGVVTVRKTPERAPRGSAGL